MASYQKSIANFLGYPVAHFPGEVKPNKVRLLDMTESAILGKVYGEGTDEAPYYGFEVVGLEYFDDNGDEGTWVKCMFLTRCYTIGSGCLHCLGMTHMV